MTKDPVQRLAEYAAARDAWLAATSSTGTSGSLPSGWWAHWARGGDAWSDIDLALVARDEHLPPLAERRRSEFGRFGEALVAIDAPNAPVGGAYLGVAYAIGELPLWVRLIHLAALDRQAPQRRSGTHRAS